MSAWGFCNRKWWFSYDQLLKPKSPVAALNVGSATHDGIEMFYKNPEMQDEDIIQSIMDKYESEEIRFVSEGGWPRDRETLDSEKELIASMLEQYFDFTKSADKFQVVSLEEEFDVPIENPYTGEVMNDLRLMGKIDGWCKINGCNYLLEHKTATICNGDWWWKYLDQAYTYIYAMQKKYNTKFHGVLFNLLVKKIPGKPKFLKNGKLSKSRLSTTPKIFRQELAKLGYKEEDYKYDILNIENRGNQFISRKVVHAKQDEITEIKHKIWHTIKDIINAKFYPRTRSDMCSRMCSFKPICQHDLEETRKELYIKKASRHSELNGTTDNESV